MGSNGHRGKGRGRGNGRGRPHNRGRGGRGGASNGSGGRGRNRTLYPSSYGFVYPLGEQDLSDDGEDFRLFGQFSDSDNEGNVLPKPSQRKEDTFDRQHRSTSAAKETKKRTRRNNKATGEYASITSTSTHFVQSTVGWNESMDHAADEERDVDLNNLHLDIGNLDIDDADFLHLLDSSLSSTRAEVSVSVDESNGDNNSNNNDDDYDDDDDDDDDEDSDSDSDSDSDNEQVDDDEEFDMAIMRDYIENVELTEEDVLNILAQTGNDRDLHEYLDGLDKDELDKLDRFLMQHGEGHMDFVVPDDDDDGDDDNDLLAYEEQYLVNHGLEDDDDEISPDMFRASLEDALAEIPPGLKPGMRQGNPHDKKAAKKQKRLEKKEKRREAKSRKQAKKDRESDAAPVPLLKIDSRIRDFINDDQLTSYQFAPMAKHSRKQLHLLATSYNLKSKSIGTGKTRTPIITKTDRTFIPTDRRYIDRFIRQSQTTMATESSALRKHRMTDSSTKGKKGSEGSNKKKDGGDPGPSTHGTVVASDAAPITDSNLGHRMLAAMGWKAGSGLGSNQEGITDPIEAVIRGKRRGLGS